MPVAQDHRIYKKNTCWLYKFTSKFRKKSCWLHKFSSNCTKNFMPGTTSSPATAWRILCLLYKFTHTTVWRFSCLLCVISQTITLSIPYLLPEFTDKSLKFSLPAVQIHSCLKDAHSFCINSNNRMKSLMPGLNKLPEKPHAWFQRLSNESHDWSTNSKTAQIISCRRYEFKGNWLKNMMPAAWIQRLPK